MPPQPTVKRAIAFVDGQNLFHAAKKAFGYSYPNYDPQKLALAICRLKNWHLQSVRFYTGIPQPQDNVRWHAFWTAKMAVLGTRGVWTFARPLRYRNETVTLGDGSTTTILVGQEKGIDVRLALDVVRLARARELDVALILSQDQDLSEVADEVRRISIEHARWIRVASAFPVSPTSTNRRGINGTEWIPIGRVMYDACIDPLDYRPGKT